VIHDQNQGTIALKKLQDTILSVLAAQDITENQQVIFLLSETKVRPASLARIVRILKNESGHALLVGVGGSGKRSLARLASHICSYTVKQISISSKYRDNEFAHGRV
jgi:dynein heavy chain